MSGPLRIITAELGAWRAARVLVKFAAASLRGEPFAHLPAAQDRRERLSRKQIGPAILLYKAARQIAPDQAYAVTQKVVLDEGAKFLKAELGGVDVVQLGEKPDAERDAAARSLGERFFNAVLRWDEIGRRRVQFTVTACRFPPLCEAGGAPEIAPMFCAVDDAYFENVDPRLRLTRAHTIAGGAHECPFILDRTD